jgi:hypothetical protein
MALRTRSLSHSLTDTKIYAHRERETYTYRVTHLFSLSPILSSTLYMEGHADQADAALKRVDAFVHGPAACDTRDGLAPMCMPLQRRGDHLHMLGHRQQWPTLVRPHAPRHQHQQHVACRLSVPHELACVAPRGGRASVMARADHAHGLGLQEKGHQGRHKPHLRQQPTSPPPHPTPPPPPNHDRERERHTHTHTTATARPRRKGQRAEGRAHACSDTHGRGIHSA